MEKALIVLLYKTAELMSFARNILELILTFLIKELFSGLVFYTENLGIHLVWQLLEYVLRNIGTNRWINY